MRKNLDLNGGIIKNMAFTTVQACKEECAATEACVAFVIQESNICYTKHKGHAAESTNSRMTSARMSCFEGRLTST